MESGPWRVASGWCWGVASVWEPGSCRGGVGVESGWRRGGVGAVFRTYPASVFAGELTSDDTLRVPPEVYDVAEESTVEFASEWKTPSLAEALDAIKGLKGVYATRHKKVLTTRF